MIIRSKLSQQKGCQRYLENVFVGITFLKQHELFLWRSFSPVSHGLCYMAHQLKQRVLLRPPSVVQELAFPTHLSSPDPR